MDDCVTRRAPYRTEHIALARDAVARGDMVLGDALADPPASSATPRRPSDADKAQSP